MKADLGMPQFDRTSPHDAIGFEVLSNYSLLMGVCSKLKAEDKKTFDDLFHEKMEEAGAVAGRLSRRFLERFAKRVFTDIDPKTQSIHFSQFILPRCKNPARWQTAEMAAKSLTVWWRSTSKGILYFTKPLSTSYGLMFPAHFFDRLTQRAFSKPIERHVAIGRFLWTMMQRHDNKIALNDSDGETMLFFEEGAGLGYLRFLHNRDRSEELPIIYLKTFISPDMLSGMQRQAALTAGGLPPIDYTYHADDLYE